MIYLPTSFRTSLQSTINWKSNWAGIRASAIAGALLTILSPLYLVQPANATPIDRDSRNYTTLDDIVDNPTPYEGRLVTIRSEPEETIDRPSARTRSGNR